MTKLEGGGFSFDIPEERRAELDKKLNKPVDGLDEATPASGIYRPEDLDLSGYGSLPPEFDRIKNVKIDYTTPETKNPYDGRVNQEALEKKRDEYIDEAIDGLMAADRDTIYVIKRAIEAGEYDIKRGMEKLWNKQGSLLCSSWVRGHHKDIVGRKNIESGNVNTTDQKRLDHEFDSTIIMKRFLERTDLLE